MPTNQRFRVTFQNMDNKSSGSVIVEGIEIEDAIATARQVIRAKVAAGELRPTVRVITRVNRITTASVVS